MLTALLIAPILAALALLAGFGDRRLARYTAIAQLIAAAFITLNYDRASAGFQFISSSGPLFPGTDLAFSLGVDGLGVVMLLLTSLVTVAATWFIPEIGARQNLLDASVLLISAGCTGAFASKDLFFFYAFHELALIPTFLSIGIWGSGERQSVAWKITIYLALGSIILLVGLLDLYLAIPEGMRTFDLAKLAELGKKGVIPAAAQARPFLFLLTGFGILVSLVPFHSWAPSAYAAAPAPVGMLHAGVLKKFGLYGLMRLAVPLLPEGASQPVVGNWTGMDLLLLCIIGNVLYAGLATIGQRKLDMLLGFSSVMHMGYVFLGIAAGNLIGLSGAALLMFGHGLSIAILLAVNGLIREAEETTAIDRLGGLMKCAPPIGVLFAFATFASIGLPGFANFSGETLVFFGAFKASGTSFIRGATFVGLWGVVISAVYMLRAYRNAFLGEARQGARLVSPSILEYWPLILLTVSLLIVGVLPNTLLNLVKPTLQTFIR